MAGSLNKVTLIGRLGADPEVKHLQNGNVLVNLRVATSERWKDKNTGEQRERTEWHRVVIWNENLAKIAEQYFKKGSLVYLEGQLQTRKWQDQSGADRYSTEVVLQGFNGTLKGLDPAPTTSGGYQRDHVDSDSFGAQPRAAAPADNDKSRAKEYGGYAGSGHGDMNDEVPF
jgi:single-strand DNA-binding protein